MPKTTNMPTPKPITMMQLDTIERPLSNLRPKRMMAMHKRKQTPRIYHPRRAAPVRTDAKGAGGGVMDGHMRDSLSSPPTLRVTLRALYGTLRYPYTPLFRRADGLG